MARGAARTGPGGGAVGSRAIAALVLVCSRPVLCGAVLSGGLFQQRPAHACFI